MYELSIYQGTVTSGGTDGTLVDEANPITGGPFLVGQEAIGSPILLGIRAVVQRPGSCPIMPSGSTADRWDLAPDDSGQPGVWAGWGNTLILSGPIGTSNTLFWARARVSGTEAIPGGALDYEDLSAELQIPAD